MEYMRQATPNWRILEPQFVVRALSRALDNAGSNIAAKIPMIAITTNNSIKVKCRLIVVFFSLLLWG